MSDLEYKKHLVRRDHELRENEEFMRMLKEMPVEEQGLFMSPFFVDETGYTFMPESTLRKFQDTIMKYYFLNNKLKEALKRKEIK